jgi:hypothetical protein
MKVIAMRRASVLGHGLCLALGAITTGCMTDGSLDEGEASVSSEVSLDPTASYTIVGVQSNRCIGPVGGSTASGARLEIETCTGMAIQRFRPEPMGGGFFRWRNEQSGLCMDVSGASISLGAPIIQFACSTGTNQQWAVADVAGGSERMTARHSGQVLDVTGQGTAPGTLLEQWASNGGANQHFFTNEALPTIVAN